MRTMRVASTLTVTTAGLTRWAAALITFRRAAESCAPSWARTVPRLESGR
jgi:hypothetical protein